MIHQSFRKYFFFAIASSLLIVFFSRGGNLLSFVWGNAGFVVLNRTFAFPSNEKWGQSAEELLRQSVSYEPYRQRGWWGLGFSLALQGRENEAILAWQHVDGMAAELGEWSERWLWDEQYQKALIWSQWMTKLAPDWGDGWYYVGLSHKGLEQWNLALTDFYQAISLPLVEIVPEKIYYQIGWISFHHITPPDLATALSAFDSAILLSEPSLEPQVIETHYQRAEVLRRLGRQEEALSEFRWVVEAQPQHYAALVGLGALLWQVEGNVDQAEAVLRKGVAVTPEIKWAYRILAQIYQETGREADAIEMYRRVLELDPNDKAVQDALEDLGIH